MGNTLSDHSSNQEPVNRGELLTEKDNPKSNDLDILSVVDLVNLFSEEDLIPQIAVSNASTEITLAIDQIIKRLRVGGRLFYLGAGTSGRLGVLDAAECPPTFCSDPEQIQGLIAGGFSSLISSSEQLEDDSEISRKDLLLKNFSAKDCLIGITAGGTTPYVLSSLDYAKQLGALAIAMSCVPKNQAELNCDIDIRLLTGPELLTGSTRLKAGTATKMALNMISTIVMIKLGKVYKNRMVDVSATNNKLIDRAIRILQHFTALDRNQALELLFLTNGSVKLSILVSLLNIDIKSAKNLLQRSDGNLRDALGFNSKV